MSTTIEIKDEFFDFNTYSKEETSNFIKKFFNFNKKEKNNKNEKEINIPEAA